MTDIALTEDERDRMKHALGIGRGGGRDYYMAGPEDEPIWDGLCERGLAKRFEQKLSPDTFYRVTPAGRSALLAALEADQ